MCDMHGKKRERKRGIIRQAGPKEGEA